VNGVCQCVWQLSSESDVSQYTNKCSCLSLSFPYEYIILAVCCWNTFWWSYSFIWLQAELSRMMWSVLLIQSVLFAGPLLGLLCPLGHHCTTSYIGAGMSAIFTNLLHKCHISVTLLHWLVSVFFIDMANKVGRKLLASSDIFCEVNFRVSCNLIAAL